MATIDDANGVVEGLPFLLEKSCIIGSCFIFGEGQDVDILCLRHAEAHLPEDAADLRLKGWAVNGGKEYPIQSAWFAARKGAANVLVTTDSEFYAAMWGAAKVCKFLYDSDLLLKEDRDTRVGIHRTLTGECL